MNRQIHRLGLVSFAAFAAMALLSRQATRPSMAAVLILDVVTTLGPLVLLVMQSRQSRQITESSSRLAFWYAFAFGCVGVAAYPIFTQDLWQYLAVGRLAAEGTNIYSHKLTGADTSAFTRMGSFYQTATNTYGPAWLWISATLSRFAGPNVGIEFAAYKLLIAGSWLSILIIAYRVLRPTPDRQFAGILLLGWLPVSITQYVIDAHNDVLMALLLVAALLTRGIIRPWFIVGAGLIKYATAPVLGLVALDAWRRRSLTIAISAVLSLVVAALIISVYWEHGALLAGLQQNQTWSAFTPVAVVQSFVRAGWLTQWIADIVILLWRGILGLVIVYFGWRYLKRLDPPSWTAAVAAIMIAILLGAPYIWPWYLIWALPAIALSDDRRLFYAFLPIAVGAGLIPPVRRMTDAASLDRVTFVFYVAVAATWAILLLVHRCKRDGQTVLATSPDAQR
jgi:hypothetical protein